MTGQRLEVTSAESRPGDQLVYITDFMKLQRAIGWHPEINLHQTLRMLKAFWEQNHQVLTRVASPLEPFAVAAEPSGGVA
jgi:UDP-glucose 4-epimerase